MSRDWTVAAVRTRFEEGDDVPAPSRVSAVDDETVCVWCGISADTDDAERSRVQDLIQVCHSFYRTDSVPEPERFELRVTNTTSGARSSYVVEGDDVRAYERGEIDVDDLIARVGASKEDRR
jgi:hypothetical protein